MKMDLSDAHHLSELRIVLMGYRAAGKSSTGNTILGREEFDLRRSAQCVKRHGEVADRHITVIEAPGWRANLSVELSPELLKQEILLSVSLCPPGPHAVLLIISVDIRFKETERKALQDHLDLLGERVWSHTIVLFTHGDCLLDTSIEQHIESEGQDLQWLMDKCGNRFHVLNNLNRSDDTQIKELLEKIEETVALNNGRHFEMDRKCLEVMDGRNKTEEHQDKRREESGSQTVSGDDGSDSWFLGSSAYASFRSLSGADPVFDSSHSRDSSLTRYVSGAIKRYNSYEWTPPNLSGDDGSDSWSVGSSAYASFRSLSGADPVFDSSHSRDSSHTRYVSGAIKRYNSYEWTPPNLSGDERSDTSSVGSYGLFRSRSGADPIFSSSHSRDSSHTRYVSGAIKRYNSYEWTPPNLSGDEWSDPWLVGSSAYGSFRSRSGADSDSVFSPSRSKVLSHSSGFRSLRSIPESVEHSGTRRALDGTQGRTKTF